MIFALLFTLEAFSNVYTIHTAHHCRDSIVYTIDMYDRHDDFIDEEIKNMGTCRNINYDVKESKNKYIVKVKYVILFKSLGIEKDFYLNSYVNMVF